MTFLFNHQTETTARWSDLTSSGFRPFALTSTIWVKSYHLEACLAELHVSG